MSGARAFACSVQVIVYELGLKVYVINGDVYVYRYFFRRRSLIKLLIVNFARQVFDYNIYLLVLGGGGGMLSNS